MRLARSALSSTLIALLLLTFIAGGTAAAAAPPPAQQEPTPTDQPPTDQPPTDAWSRILDEGVIVFGTAADYPPFEFYNSTFELEGFDIALAQALGEQLGLEVRFKDYAFDGLLSTVQLGDVDAAIAAISVTPDRQQIVDFSNLYYVGNSVVLASDTFTGTIRSATDFAGLTVGVQRGTTFEARAQEMLVDAGVITQEELVSYPTVSAAIVDVRNGTIDVAILGQLTAERAAKNGGGLIVVGEGFYQQQYAIAAPKGSNLIGHLNTALVALQSDGTFADLVERYLRDAPEEVTPDEEAAVVENVPVTDTLPAPAACIDGMTFVGDINLDDQNMLAPPIMAPGEDFTKGWRLRNSGTCTWQPDYAMTYVNGNRVEASMGGMPTPLGREVPPGDTIDVYVNMRAPQVYGTFQGFWQLRNSQQQYFGEVVWVGIQVPDPNPPPPPPPPPPSKPTPNLRADADWITQGQCTTIRWDIDGVMAVFFVENGAESGVGGHDARTVCPPGTTTYVLRVLYSDGTTSDYPITINVNPSSDYTLNFWADSTSIDAGQCTTLRWDVRNVQAVYLNGEGVPGVSERDVCPGSTTTYTLEVTKLDGGRDSRQVTVEVRNVQPPPVEWPEIERFSVSSNEINLGDCVSFEWRTDNADNTNLFRSGTPLLYGGGTNGSAQDCPGSPGLQEYRLDAYSNVGQVSQTIMVGVRNPGIHPR